MSISRRMITKKELDFYLYGRADVLPVKLENGSREEEQAKQQTIAKKIPQYEEKSVDILQLRYKPGVEKEFRSSDEFKKVLTAIKSIPPQLHLCYSSIPGAGFGICATENIPSGTWIGPFAGKRVSVEEIGSMLDTRYVWEIYKNGVFDHCIDGMEHSEEQGGCWMKYIQCARNITEQNTVAFQYGADLYFQTYKAIRSGEEILVWYAEYYEQHHGIPVGVRKKDETKKTSQTDIVENAKRTISEITATTTAAAEKPQPIKSQSLNQTPMTKPPSLRSSYVGRPEPPPISTGGNLPHNPSSECQSSPNKPKSLLILSGVHRGKKGTVSDAANIRTAMASQLPRTEDLHHATNNFRTRFWKCVHCLSKFPQKWALQVHSCPCVVTKPYLCSNCGKAYFDRGDLQEHASQCGGGRKYKCGYCGRSFLNVHILGKHIKVHSKKSVAAGAFKKKTIALKDMCNKDGLRE